MWEILSGKKVQKMGGVQVCNEASEALLAHKQTRASVMSVQREKGGWGLRESREACCEVASAHQLSSGWWWEAGVFHSSPSTGLEEQI